MTNEQSAALLRLSKQVQAVALNAVELSDTTENSRVSEFGQRIKWIAGLFDLNLTCNHTPDNPRWYFIRKEWGPSAATNKQLFIKCGFRTRAYGHSFVIFARKYHNADMAIASYWGSQGKAIDGLNQKKLGVTYDCLTGEENTDLIIATLKDQNSSGMIGTPAAEAARTYRTYILENDGIEDESNWFLPLSDRMLLMYRYRDKTNETIRTLQSSDGILMIGKYYRSSAV